MRSYFSLNINNNIILETPMIVLRRTSDTVDFTAALRSQRMIFTRSTRKQHHVKEMCNVQQIHPWAQNNPTTPLITSTHTMLAYSVAKEIVTRSTSRHCSSLLTELSDARLRYHQPEQSSIPSTSGPVVPNSASLRPPHDFHSSTGMTFQE